MNRTLFSRLARWAGCAQLGLIGVLALPHGARGQVVSGQVQETEAGSADLQAQCNSVVGTLLSDTAARAPRWYYDAVGRCEQTGPAAIAQQWRTISGEDPERLLALQRSSRAVRDARILAALSDVVRNGSRPAPVGIAAVDVLVGYAVPAAALSPLDPSNEGQLRRQSALTKTAVNGAQPLGPGVLDDVAYTLWQVARSAAPAASRGVSMSRGEDAKRGSQGGAARPGRSPRQRLAPRRGLARDDFPAPSGDVGARAALASAALDNEQEAADAAWSPSDLTLNYVCGNRFRLQSTHYGPIRQGLTYVVEGSGLPPEEVGVTNYVATEFTAPAAGTVRLLHLGKTIATAANGGQACPDGRAPASSKARTMRAPGQTPAPQRGGSSTRPDRARRP